ncbi:hypothetical protein [Thermanaeromonas toyohensis]|uniref:hypothetical protein n=1 Tax=Thermanaeromonas toyohensis TaxID=161154 RepID=UPI00155FAC1F|nr:hypothetical protein [Thermanaeromonas toyohensis]
MELAAPSGRLRVFTDDSWLLVDNTAHEQRTRVRRDRGADEVSVRSGYGLWCCPSLAVKIVGIERKEFFSERPFWWRPLRGREGRAGCGMFLGVQPARLFGFLRCVPVLLLCTPAVIR